MLKGKNMDSHALFQSTMGDGSQLLFVVSPPDNNWAITRDKLEVAAGTSPHASVYSGVNMYLSIARHEPRLAGAVGV